MPKKLSLIVVNHNGERFLDKLFASLKNQSLNLSCEFLMADTQSTDNSISLIKSKHPDVKIYPVENNGYGYACNIMATHAKGEYLMFLNEDMYFDPDFLKNMFSYRKTLEKDKQPIGIIGCKIIPFDVNPGQQAPDFGGKNDILGFPQKNTKDENIFHPNGCPVFIKRELFNKVGGYNPNIKYYSVDVDFSWRVILFGYKNFITNSAYIYHFGGAATNQHVIKKMADVIGGILPMLLCNYSLLTLILTIPTYLFVSTLLSIFLSILKRQPRYLTEVYKYWHTVLVNYPKIAKFRAFVQNHRKIDDFHVISTYISAMPSLIANKFEK